MNLRKNLSSLRRNLDKKAVNEKSTSSNESISGGEPNLLHFDLEQIIGQGAFGKVRIVEQISTHKKFALKYINKAECIKSRSTRNIFRERIILQQMNHPFILNMRYAFQDEEYLYFILDLALGGDMKFNIKHGNGFDNHTLAIYAAEVSCALNYLHNNQIIHRDLKPENLILDERGHVYITDFNCSVSLKERTPDAQAGTLEYMAPEMFAQKQYKFSVDWWSFGVILYQCAYGFTPFKEANGEKTIEAICKKKLQFPKVSIGSEPCGERDLFIAGLLERDISLRIGSSDNGLGYTRDVMTNRFLKNINWELLEDKKLCPTTVPKTGQNYEKDTIKNDIGKEGGDMLSQKFKSQKDRGSVAQRSGWLVSRVSSFISKHTTKSKNESLENLNISTIPSPSTETNLPKTRENIESDAMVKYFSPFDYEKFDNEPVTLPPIWSTKKPIKKAVEGSVDTTPRLNDPPSSQSSIPRQKSHHDNLQKEAGRQKTLTRKNTLEKPSPLRAALQPNSDSDSSITAAPVDPTIPRKVKATTNMQNQISDETKGVEVENTEKMVNLVI